VEADGVDADGVDADGVDVEGAGLTGLAAGVPEPDDDFGAETFGSPPPLEPDGLCALGAGVVCAGGVAGAGVVCAGGVAGGGCGTGATFAGAGAAASRPASDFSAA
jgi:hypothetical protein